MDICNDLNRIILEFVEPNAGSILDAWLTYAQTTKSKAKFAKRIRLHIPTVDILWLDVEYKKNRNEVHIDVTVTTWEGHDVWHGMSKNKREKDFTPFCANDVIGGADLTPSPWNVFLEGTNLTTSTKVDLHLGHWKRFWQKPKEKAILGIPVDLEIFRRAVLETRFLKQEF
jgi:hypothetical protein